MKTWKAALACGLMAGGITAGSPPAHAQGAAFPDVPANHWAYQAVQDLADKGYVKGYPDGRFLGKRAMTRYEFATVIDRMAQTITDLSAQVKAGQAVTTATGTPVTQDDLNKIQVLTDSFQKQLADIQSVTAGATSPFQAQIDAVRADILDIQANVAKAQATANNSYGAGADRKFQISGYVQARYQESGKAQDLYPSGTSAKSGTYNGNYAEGGDPESFEVRRARLKFTGAVTDNTRFGVQIDTSGAVTAGATPNQQVTVREGYVAYTFGDGKPAHAPTFTAGLFANPFGFALPSSMANFLTPERPLAFSEAGYGIWANQDYDKGVQLSYNTPQQLIGFLPGGLKLTAALVNGNGRTGENNDRHFDGVYRVGYQTPNKILGVGVSYYDGEVPAVAATTGTAYHDDRKQLFGVDGQVTTPVGVFANAEYESGKYEQLFRFTSQTASSAVDAPGNKIEGYYGQIGYSFFSKTDKPLSFFFDYDVLRRSEGSGIRFFNATNALVGLPTGQYTDENYGYGASYNLDRATRLRVYYDRPDQVAHAPGFTPEKISQTTAELQVKF